MRFEEHVVYVPTPAARYSYFCSSHSQSGIKDNFSTKITMDDNSPSNEQPSAPVNTDKTLEAPQAPKVVGIYGVSGCGKSTIRKQLEQKMPTQKFRFFEGSQRLWLEVSPEEFNHADMETQTGFRELAISKIADECVKDDVCGVVVAHHSLPTKDLESFKEIMSDKDKSTYTHIVYLQVSPRKIAERVKQDLRSGTKTDRKDLSESKIQTWQTTEIEGLRQTCKKREIPFFVLDADAKSPDELSQWFTAALQRFVLAGDGLDTLNGACVAKAVESAVFAQDIALEKLMVLDGDRTLAAVNTTRKFWALADQRGLYPLEQDLNPVDKLFKTEPYSLESFRKAASYYTANFTEAEFNTLCEDVASDVSMHSEFKTFLDTIAKRSHLGAVVVTSGLRRVWENVLRKSGVPKRVRVIGMDYGESYVVSTETKAEVVDQLKSDELEVWAFGDSALDLPMLKHANEAFVVVGKADERSSSMDKELPDAIRGGLKAKQILLPSTVTPRLDTDLLPIITLDASELQTDLVAVQYPGLHLKIHHATESGASKLLQTPTRDNQVFSHVLRKAHGRVGHHLTAQYITDLIGTEEYDIINTRGKADKGHRLRNEQKTVIVPLMRGGEPMAFGVSEALPLAVFVHAKTSSDITDEHLEGVSTVVLVDAVVNSGNSIRPFVERLVSFNAAIKIFVVAGVVQSGVVRSGGLLRKLCLDHDVEVVALRLSENKYMGKGATDTGARLFNTTQIE